MLTLGSTRFTSGRSRFEDHAPGRPETTAKIYIRVRFDEYVTYAQLDTGAAWSVMAPDVAQSIGLSALHGDPARLITWLGIKEGYLIKVPFIIPADHGEDLDLSGTFFVSEDWPEGLTFLGYSGLLDAIRFALDPQVNDFYFGI